MLDIIHIRKKILAVKKISSTLTKKFRFKMFFEDLNSSQDSNLQNSNLTFFET